MIYIHVDMSFGDNGAAVHWVAVKKHRRTHVVNSYIYIQGCFAGDRVRPVVKANACKKRKTTAKGSLRLHFHGLTSYGQLNSFGAERQKKKGLISNHWLGSQVCGRFLFFSCTRYVRTTMKFNILFCI